MQSLQGCMGWQIIRPSAEFIMGRCFQSGVVCFQSCGDARMKHRIWLAIGDPCHIVHSWRLNQSNRATTYWYHSEPKHRRKPANQSRKNLCWMRGLKRYRPTRQTCNSHALSWCQSCTMAEAYMAGTMAADMAGRGSSALSHQNACVRTRSVV